MPCYEPPWGPQAAYQPPQGAREGATPEQSAQIADLAKAYGDLRFKVNLLADLLCMAGRAVKAGHPFPKPVLDWWQAHSEWDANRGEPWPGAPSKESPTGPGNG